MACRKRIESHSGINRTVLARHREHGQHDPSASGQSDDQKKCADMAVSEIEFPMSVQYSFLWLYWISSCLDIKGQRYRTSLTVDGAIEHRSIVVVFITADAKWIRCAGSVSLKCCRTCPAKGFWLQKQASQKSIALFCYDESICWSVYDL